MTYAEWVKLQEEKYGAKIVDTARRRVYNRNADEAQFERYKALLGDEAPKTFEDFQKIKYDSAESYATLKTAYADKRIQQRLLSNPKYTTLKTGQQGKDILGHNNYIKGRILYRRRR